MRDALWQLVRAGLSKLDPEFAHNLSIKALRTGLAPWPPILAFRC